MDGRSIWWNILLAADPGVALFPKISVLVVVHVVSLTIVT